MRRVKDIKKVLQIRFSAFAAIQSNQRNGNDRDPLRGACRCDGHCKERDGKPEELLPPSLCIVEKHRQKNAELSIIKGEILAKAGKPAVDGGAQ